MGISPLLLTTSPHPTPSTMRPPSAFALTYPCILTWLGSLTDTKTSEVKSLSRVWLCDPMSCSLPGSSLHRILQARVLEWVAISFSRGSSRRRDQTQVSRILDRCFNLWATREASEKTEGEESWNSVMPNTEEFSIYKKELRASIFRRERWRFRWG